MTSTDLPVHPTTGLVALGVTSRGPVWPVMGGDGTGDGSTRQDGGQQGAGGDGGQDTGQQQGQGQQDPGNQGQQQGGQEPPLGPDGQPLDPVRLQRLVENLRSEISTLKGKQNSGQQQPAQQGQGQAPAPQQQNTQQPQPQQQGQQQAGQEPAPTDDGTADKLAAATAELAIFKAAGKHGADPVKLTDSRSFMDKVADLPNEDREKKLAELIKKTLDDYPHYRSGQAPGTAPRGGSDGTGRPGAPNRPKGLDGALAAHYAKK